MATLSELGRSRKNDLRKLRSQFLKTKGAFNATLRKLDQLVNRKEAVPELIDLQRVVALATDADREWDMATQAIMQLQSNWY